MRNIKRKINTNICSIVVAPIILAIIIMIAFACGNSVNASKYYETKKIVVYEGDTLWNIASKICKSNDNLNVYSVMEDIKKINNMDSSLVYIGQILEVYAY